MNAVAPRAEQSPWRRMATAFIAGRLGHRPRPVARESPTKGEAVWRKDRRRASTGSLHCDHGYVEWQIPRNRAEPRSSWFTPAHQDVGYDVRWRDGFRNIFSIAASRSI